MSACIKSIAAEPTANMMQFFFVQWMSQNEENFPGWSLQTSAMHQLAIWVMLEDVGFGASLQHYNPLIDEEVRRAWDLPEHWHLIAEMPFGLPVGKPGEKEFQPLEERVRIFK